MSTAIFAISGLMLAANHTAREALLCAARGFDLLRANRFSSYATFRVRAALQSALAQSEPLPMPVSEWRLQRRVAAIANRQRAEGLSPSSGSIAMELSCPPEDIEYHFAHAITVAPLETAENLEDPATANRAHSARQLVARAAAQLFRKLDRIPLPGELAVDLGVDMDVILGALAGDPEDAREVQAVLRGHAA